MPVRFAVCAATAVFGAEAFAQDAGSLDLRGAEADRVAILDFNAAYNGSDFGRRIQAEFTAARESLDNQNRYFDCVLVKEENEIADAKPTMDEDSFNERRSEFTAKAGERRRVQDEKQNMLVEWADAEIGKFREAVAHVSEEVAMGRDLDAILFDEGLAWYDRGFELSWLFVQLLNRDFGDGTGGDYVAAAVHAGLDAADIDPVDADCADELAAR